MLSLSLRRDCVVYVRILGRPVVVLCRGCLVDYPCLSADVFSTLCFTPLLAL